MPLPALLPALLPVLLLSLFLSSGCGNLLNAQGTKVSRSYYHFLKSQYDELIHKDEEALSSIKLASKEAGSPYYLELETAKLLARKGRIEESLRYVERAMTLNPEDPEPRLFAGYLASITGRFGDAERNYLEALRLDPKNEEAISFLGAMYAESGRLDEASEAFKKLSAITPASNLPDYFLGRIAQRKGDTAQAAAYFKSSHAKNPEFVESLIELALINEQLGDAKAAEKNYREILELNPDIPMAKARLSRILLRAGKRTEALSLIEDLSGESQTPEEAGLTLGLMFLEENLFSNAAKEFKGVLRKNPNNSHANYLLGLTEAQEGRMKESIDFLKKVPPQSEVYVDATLFLATVLSRENRRPEALDAISLARRNHADSPMLLVAEGRIMEEMDRIPQSRDLYMEGTRLFPASADVHFSLGVAEHRLGRVDECLKAMKKAVELDPEFSEAINYLAYTYAEENLNLKEALTLALKANALKPDNGYYLDTLGWVYFKLGDTAKAYPLLERAAMISGEDPVIMEHLGDILSLREEYPAALKAYSKALERGHEEPQKINEKMGKIVKK
jgi:tetratricopeptide (TPR) repeat protein